MIYVDEVNDYTGITNLRYKKWSHLWNDGPIEELHKFASQLDLNRRWFQDKKRFPHYDIVPSKRTIALKMGATFIPLREWYERRERGEIQ